MKISDLNKDGIDSLELFFKGINTDKIILLDNTEYEYLAENANRIVNKTSEFPEACSMKIYAYFRDKCNENVVYSGVIVANKAKLNPESIELALTSTGKHAFEFQMMRDYCDEEAELFSIIVAE